ncbi:MAG TPA: DUF6498-containing protein [Sedimentisphaerales bacterium]|nr:DUF6498-containing protein [Sedimentisphaerales bacterium]
MSETSQNIKSKHHFYSDLSFWSLLIANIIAMLWALKKGWSLEVMIWVFFVQNIILGIFWPAKVFDSPMDSWYVRKVSTVGIFLPHYLIMHFLYGLSLYTYFGKEPFAAFKYISIMAGIFLLSEVVSYFAKDSLNRTRPLSLAEVQLFPYARVVPMHFVVCIGTILLKAGITDSHLIVMCFLLLKAFADVAMYMVERSSLFTSLVTDFFERQKESMFWGYSNSKEKQQVCRFCQRTIRNDERPWVIKGHVFCEECYDTIEKEKEKTS